MMTGPSSDVNVVAVIPVKALDGAKQRLSAALDAQTRAELVLWLLGKVVGAAKASDVIDELAVVSPDPTVLARASELGAIPLHQATGDLNAGLELGRCWALELHARMLCVILGDLPLLRGADIEGMFARARAQSRSLRAGVVLAPDRAGSGTNVLLLHPPDCLPFAFGEGSRAKHEAMARRQGLGFELYDVPGTAFDVDRVADLEELHAGDQLSGAHEP